MNTEEQQELTKEELDFANRIRAELNINIFDVMPISIFREIVKNFNNEMLLGNIDKNPVGLLSIIEK